MSLPDLRPQSILKSPEQLVAHLRSFELEMKFSAGIWYMSPPESRFHGKYKKDMDIERRLEIAAPLADAGLSGIEAHYPNEINEENLELWKSFSKDTGIRIVTVVPLLFYDGRFEFGSLSNPDPKIRTEAISRTVETLRINQELGTDFAVVWSGIDGYENGFGIDLASARARFIDGLAEAMDSVPGLRVAFEPKPYEPRGHHLFGTTPEGLLLGLAVESKLKHPDNVSLLDQGHALVAMNPEIGHMLMAYEDLPYAFSQVMEYGRLAHCHVNSQPLGNYDQDLNVGVVAPEQLEAALYAMKTHGYSGYFGIDINPERMPVQRAIINSMDAIKSANDRINAMDHESIVWASEHPAKSRGWIEAHLTRMRALHPERLSPMPELPMDED